MKTTLPLAAPGEAGNPEAIISFSTFSSKVGCNKVSKVFGSILLIASFFAVSYTHLRATAILIAALAVLFPDLVCNIQSLLFSTVNSISCISL